MDFKLVVECVSYVFIIVTTCYKNVTWIYKKRTFMLFSIILRFIQTVYGMFS